MHKMQRDIVVTSEFQKSKATFVQESTGWTFDELVQKMMRDPIAMQQMQAKRSSLTKERAIANLDSGSVYTHPFYMTDKEVNNFSEVFTKDLEYYELKEQAIREAEEAERARQLEELKKQQIIAEYEASNAIDPVNNG